MQRISWSVLRRSRASRRLRLSSVIVDALDLERQRAEIRQFIYSQTEKNDGEKGAAHP